MKHPRRFEQVGRRLPAALLSVVVSLAAACGSTDETTDQPGTTLVRPPDIVGTVAPTEDTVPQWYGEPTHPLAIHLGECVIDWDWVEDGERIQIITKVPCDGVHHREVYYETSFPADQDALYPGEELLNEFARNECYREFEPFVGRTYEESELDLLFTVPPEREFLDSTARYRGITCFVVAPDGQELTGTARSSAR
ncbi:MAG: hypothetical protein HKN26_15150 [Acidimicrobiales bacterium]|nr:hypothetical protein [Acidimicrobiales bacterium]